MSHGTIRVDRPGRKPMMPLTALIGLCVISRQVETRITLTIQATNVKHAVELLGAAANLTLLTSPQTANDIVTFRFADLPISEAMRRIADVENATWKKENGALRLVRTAKLQQAESELELNREILGYSKAISQRADALKKQLPWNDGAATQLAEQVKALLKDLPRGNPPSSWRQKAQNLVSQAPLARAMRGIVASMDPAELAGLPDGIRTVWSTRPTRTQRPLSPKIAGIIEQYVREQAAWVRTVNSYALVAPDIKENPHWTEQLGELLGRTAQPIATVLLAAEPNFGVDLELTTYDDLGNRLAQASDSIQASYPSDDEALKFLFPTADDKPLSLTGDERLLLDYAHTTAVNERGPPPPGLLSKLIDPDHSDPLGLGASPLIVQVARARGLNLIARLPDGAFNIGSLYKGGKNDGLRVFKNLHFAGCLLDAKDGWLTIKPDQPATSRVIQANRSDLARFMQRSNSDKPLSIDEQAQYRGPLPEQHANNMPWSLAVFLNRPNTRFLDTPFLHFYAQATTQQKVRMSGDGMPVSDLNSAERDILERLVYGARGYPLVFTPIPGGDAEASLHSTGILSESTEALPNGLPPNGFVTMREESAYSVYLESSADKVIGGEELFPGRFVMYKYFQDHPREIRPSNPVLSFDLNHFMVGKRLTVTFTFQFTPTLSMTGTLRDGNVTDLRPATFDDLPKDFKAECDKEYKEWAAMMSMRSAGASANSVPPP